MGTFFNKSNVYVKRKQFKPKKTSGAMSGTPFLFAYATATKDESAP